LFTIFVRWLYLKGKLNQVEWDMATITAADYTVEMPIKEKSYLAWYQREYMKADGDFSKEIPALLSLKRHMINVIEDQLTKDLESTRMNGQLNHGPLGNLKNKLHKRLEISEIKVADIAFATENHDLINLLKVRGGQIVA